MLNTYLFMVETEDDKEKVVYIYENYYAFMKYTASRILKSEHDIEDAVHTAMIRIIDNLDIIDFSDKKRAKSFCGVVSKNVAIDMCKSARCQREESLETTVDVNSEDGELTDIVIRKETYEAVVRAIYDLDEKYRDVCVLRFVNELKEREIAEVLKLPIKTVDTRIRRGRKILCDVISKVNENE